MSREQSVCAIRQLWAERNSLVNEVSFLTARLDTSKARLTVLLTNRECKTNSYHALDSNDKHSKAASDISRLVDSLVAFESATATDSEVEAESINAKTQVPSHEDVEKVNDSAADSGNDSDTSSISEVSQVAESRSIDVTEINNDLVSDAELSIQQPAAIKVNSRSIAQIRPKLLAAGLVVSDGRRVQENYRFKQLADKLFNAISSQDSESVVKLLRVGGSRAANSVDRRGLPLLYAAVQPGNARCVRELLRYNANPNATIPICRWSALHRAAACGDYECTQLLLMFGAELASKKSDGGTPLQLARRNRHDQVAQLLINAGETRVVFDEPVSLKLLCAMGIRRQLGRDCSKFIDLLPVIRELKFYINHHDKFKEYSSTAPRLFLPLRKANQSSKFPSAKATSALNDCCNHDNREFKNDELDQRQSGSPYQCQEANETGRLTDISDEECGHLSKDTSVKNDSNSDYEPVDDSLQEFFPSAVYAVACVALVGFAILSVRHYGKIT